MFLTVVTDLLPRNSDSIPLVLVYLFCVLVLCSLAVAVSIIIVAKADGKTGEVGNPQRNYMSPCIYLC